MIAEANDQQLTELLLCCFVSDGIIGIRRRVPRIGVKVKEGGMEESRSPSMETWILPGLHGCRVDTLFALVICFPQSGQTPRPQAVQAPGF